MDAHTARRQSYGFTLVELLVVIAIIGVLVSLLLPAVQAARESARRTQCANHLRNLALACLVHEQTHGYLPSAGWHFQWAGDPDRGFGQTQPGAWTYSLLPFLEEQALFDLGSDGNPDQITNDQRRETRDRLTSPITVLHCPSRRSAQRYPSWAAFGEPGGTPVNSFPVDDDLVAKCDYAINGGGRVMTNPWPRPPGNAMISMDWPETGEVGNGVAYQRSQVELHQITDGTTHTFLLGEKFLEPARYLTTAHSDHHGMGVFYWDTMRYASDLPANELQPLRDTNLGNTQVMRDVNSCCLRRFGSAHPGGMHMAMCDASIRKVSYAIDPVVYRNQGDREDGGILNAN